MSSKLSIASVTAILKHLLYSQIIDTDLISSIGNEITVSALPPDQIVTGADEKPALNLFLYQITPNTQLRTSQRSQLRQPDVAPHAFALDLHYLVSAYGSQDFHTEILLGYALHILQSKHELPQDAIETILHTIAESSDSLSAVMALKKSSLARQIDYLEIRPQFLNIEELSKIWSALQARYRPSACYKVSIVLIDT
jgi:hypothetical protein